MKPLRFLWITIIQTLLRLFPFPCKTGLIKIGHPDRQAPVLLTSNFGLTVERVKRALQGIDAYLLVANSHGINVWCAAAGGHLTNHEVISVLKTSGIENLVDHRHVILPQLAATGMEGKVIRRKTGWRVVWGPARADDLPAFLSSRFQKSVAMRTVTFPWPQRLEMAVAWAFPISLLALVMLPFWSEGVLPLIGLIWGLSLLLFLSFPLYQKHLRTTEKRVGFVLFDFGERGLPLVLWGLFMLGLVGYTVLTGTFSWAILLRWGLSALIILLILSLDLTGSTPVFKSGLHEERRFRIALDAEKCEGIAFCEETCPVNVFEVDRDRRLAMLPRSEHCVQCGACIVQCPFDALYFRHPDGECVTPQTIRTYKLNLLGSRRVEPGRREEHVKNAGDSGPSLL